MRTVTDMLGRELSVPEKPQRIISLVPSQTELLADLGLEEEVVGITKFCVHPERWFRSKARIGGTKTVRIEKVAALKPDLILANKEENVREQIETLQDIAPVWVSDIQTLDDALRMMRQVGSLCGKHAEANSLAQNIEQRFVSLRLHSSAAHPVAYGIWRDPWMWAGGDTFISDLLHHLGWTNALHDAPRYPVMSLEDLVASKPATVLLSSEPYPFKEKHIAEVKAVLPNANVLLVDGEMFSWYGSRLLHAPAYFATLLEQMQPA
jgi:ABC-type Fe3+-hydroxamate transport system substrate-binding protein